MDDIVETLMMNMFNNSKLKAMPPKLLSDDKRNVVIRPLSYCREKDIEQLSTIKNYPIIPCNLCGSQENLQRKQVKKMLKGWDEETPGRIENVFKSTQSISPSQLSDHNLYDFSTLAIDRTAEPKEQEFGGADISSSNLIDVKNIEIIDAS
jgi:tRNA 2-thiocytidine biosynthesis protein TtcA